MQVIGWRTVLDICILTLILYSLYRTLRMTGTWKIVIGLTIAGIVASIARFFDLQGVDWLFSNFSQIILIALVIIFQPEIRRILERSIIFSLLENPLIWGQSRAVREQLSIAELLDKALFDLAERKWGALIVIPGKISIEQWVTGGTTMDALPSQPLLLSLFDTSSPGHDGAVIMENGRISRFGVHLPLADPGALSDSYGTRHHAAMGLAQETDALVLLVSEERGVVSFFKNGAMKRLAKRGGAVQVMEDHFAYGQKSRPLLSSYKKFLYTGLEIGLSLVVAILFWSALVQPRTEVQEKLFTVPVEYVKGEKNLRIDQAEQEATILLAGPQASLDRVDPAMLPITVDLHGLEAGKHSINVTSDIIAVPRNLKLLQVHPESLLVELHHINILQATVKPQFTGELSKELHLVSVKVTPEVLPLIDKRKNPDKAKVVLDTTPIFLENIRQSTTVYCKVNVPKSFELENDKLSDVAVQLTVESVKKGL